MAINYIVFNGESSLDKNVYVSGDQAFDSPEKNYERVSIPGRNGDLLIPTGSFKNVTLRYKAIVLPGEDWIETSAKVREWLLKDDGYLRLEDTYNPDEFRAACFTGPLNFTTYLLTAGETELVFDCKPQRYLKSGDVNNPIVITGSYVGSKNIVNPTGFTALPRITIKGSGTVTLTFVNGNDTNTITIKNLTKSNYMTIDSETMVVSDSMIQNRNADANIGDFPEFRSGTTVMSWSTTGTLSEISIVPRWWRA